MIGSTLEQLQNAIDCWAEYFSKIYTIITTDPTEFQGGTAWANVTNVLSILQGAGVCLIVFFYGYGLLKSSIDYRDFTRSPKLAIMSLIHVGIAEFLVVHASDVLLKIISVVQSVIRSVPAVGLSSNMTVPSEIETALNNASWWSRLGAWFMSLICMFVVFALVIIIIVVIYGRFFKIFLLTAISPLPLAGFASQATSSLGVNFLKSYICELLRGVVMLVACGIFSTFIASGALSHTIDPSDTAGKMVAEYVMDIIMQLLLLTITIKGSDRLVKELFGLGG